MPKDNDKNLIEFKQLVIWLCTMVHEYCAILVDVIKGKSILPRIGVPVGLRARGSSV
jgi:hypothetical protein